MPISCTESWGGSFLTLRAMNGTVRALSARSRSIDIQVNRIWKFDNADNGITNLLILGDRVYLADASDLIALDRQNGKRIFKKDHQFKTAPKFIGLNESSLLVLTGEQNVGAFEQNDGKRTWFLRTNPPGIGFWKRVASSLLVSTGAISPWPPMVLPSIKDFYPRRPLPQTIFLIIGSTSQGSLGAQARD